MGILNVTPDSFSDGGRFDRLDAALAHVESMLNAGATLIDVGGESTRPGAAPVSTEEELHRVVPMVEAIASRFDVVISVDTSTPEVMTQSAAVGAGFINDVRSLERDGALLLATTELLHLQRRVQVRQRRSPPHVQRSQEKTRLKGEATMHALSGLIVWPTTSKIIYNMCIIFTYMYIY